MTETHVGQTRWFYRLRSNPPKNSDIVDLEIRYSLSGCPPGGTPISGHERMIQGTNVFRVAEFLLRSQEEFGILTSIDWMGNLLCFRESWVLQWDLVLFGANLANKEECLKWVKVTLERMLPGTGGGIDKNLFLLLKERKDG